jgi:hypothetical protein
MNPSDSKLPPALDAAINRVKTTVVAVAERVAVSLGTQAQSATRIFERDLVLATHIDLRRKINAFHLTFSQTLQERIQRELLPRYEQRRRQAAADWQSLTLVEDHEVEERMHAERLAQQISHACEWELRDLATYMGTVLGLGRAEEDRNPLRAEVLGEAVYRAIEAITADHDGRKLLAREFGQAMAQAMPACYTAIIGEMQAHNIRPVNLSLRHVEGPGNQLGGGNSGYESLRDDFRPSAGTGGAPPTAGGRDTSRGAATASGSGLSTSGAAGFRSPRIGTSTHRLSTEADAQLMALLRRLTFLASRPGALDPVPSGGSAAGGFDPSGGRPRSSAMGLPVSARAVLAEGEAGSYGDELTGMMAVNLIRAHREELLQASSGKLDHMVIDVVGTLFDQILSDTRVPPQMARQIARLQLPVLRVALADSTFFSSRRHPVRRFVNRIGSLACAFDNFDDGPGKQLLERVRGLVEQIVEGDFDQLDLYTDKLAELEAFIEMETQREAKDNGSATLLETKESDLRIQQRYMQRLRTALAGVAIPAYLSDFVAQVWSQALVLAVRRDGPDSELAKRFRNVGRDLVMSVQPKGLPMLRKRFLMQLPTLMKDLNEGLKLIGWPEPAQKEFFGRLLPSHAESLKAAPISELDYNLLAKQLEAIFGAPIPSSGDFNHAEPVALAPAEIEQRFTPEEAKQVGLVEESAVDWSGEVDIDITADAAGPDTLDTAPDSAPDTLPAPIGIDINLDLVAADPAEPSRGPQLMDHIKLGFAYQMLLKDQWQKVRLSYVSPGRSFFVFTRGRKHQETISLTSRMLARMCETNRLRAVESAYLMERATARARRQLAALKAPSRH